MTDPLAQALAKQAVEGADPYTGVFEQGFAPNTGPGSQPFEPLPTVVSHPRPLERNVCVGPLVVSSCLCPQCGEVFAHYELFRGGYNACLADGEQPLCHRCRYATTWPTAPAALIDAMVELRWRYEQHLVASEPGSGQSRGDMHAAFVRVADAFWRHGPTLLHELERVYGDQVQRGVQAILSGATGVA